MSRYQGHRWTDGVSPWPAFCLTMLCGRTAYDLPYTKLEIILFLQLLLLTFFVFFFIQNTLTEQSHVVLDLLYIREKGTIKQGSDWTNIRICTSKLCKLLFLHPKLSVCFTFHDFVSSSHTFEAFLFLFYQQYFTLICITAEVYTI